MNKKICKIIILVMVILAIIIGIMYLIDLDRMKKGKEIVFSTWGAKYSPVVINNSNENGENINSNNTENYQTYSKTIDNTKLELNIPNEWKYKEMPRDEENDFYKYALKLYKNNENQYAILYFYNSAFGVCGTGRTSKDISLNNGKEATIGYYDGNKNWSDISFFNINPNIAVINYNLIDTDAEEVVEFIKTINIINEKNEYSFMGKVIESSASYIIVEPNADEGVRKSFDKISIGLGDYNDVMYNVGANVKIIYDGTIMESDPAQVKAAKIEIK